MKYLICFLISDVVFFFLLFLSVVKSQPEIRFSVCAPTSGKKMLFITFFQMFLFIPTVT